MTTTKTSKPRATTRPKPLKVGGKLTAYVAVTDDGQRWYIGVVVDGDVGYRPVSDYGPYDEERAEGVAARLNARINVDPRTAAAIIARSMRKNILKAS